MGFFMRSAVCALSREQALGGRAREGEEEEEDRGSSVTELPGQLSILLHRRRSPRLGTVWSQPREGDRAGESTQGSQMGTGS